ncbi:hypothetical protein OSTOST_19923, partial [Ostertagia ostertagi]
VATGMASPEPAESKSENDVKLFSVTLPRPIAYTYLLSILYNITFFMQFMSTPYFLKSLGVSDTENVGSMKFLTARLRPTLADVKTLMLSRIPCIFMHGQQGHQTLLSALTNPGKERTNAFGRMGLTFVLCIVPSLTLGETAFSEVIAECKLNKPIKDQCENVEERSQSMSVSNVSRILNKPGVLNVMFKKNAPILPMLLVFAIMQLYLVEQFQADSVAFGLFFFFHWLWMIVVVMPFIAFGMSLVATVADSLLTALVAENEQGLVLGVATSFNSLLRTFAPTISGYILETFGFSTFALIGSISTAVGHAAIFLFPLQESLLRKPKAE